MTISLDGRRIPVPANFPVTWDPPEHEDLFWFWDQMHHPHPVTPLTLSLDGPAFSEGIGRAAQALYLPIKTYHVRGLNSFWYMSTEVPALSAAESTELQEKLDAEMAQLAPRCLHDWENVYLPEVMTLNQCLRDYPYREASLKELAGFLDEVAANRTRQWELHMLAVIPVIGIAQRFADVYEEVFGRPDNNEHYQMLQGFPNKSVEAGQALYDLAREALRMPGVADVVRDTPVDGIFAALGRFAAGKALAAMLNAYLDTYGWRSDQFELMDPSWREDPSPALNHLRGCLREDATNPRAEQAKAAAERERLVREMLERAPDDARRNELQMLVTAAQQYLPVQENHNFYIDQMNTVLLRLPLLEIGRCLVEQGTIDDRDDVFFLQLRELQEAAVTDDGGWRRVIAQRRAEIERWWNLLPPLTIGTKPPPDAPPQRAGNTFWGIGPEPSRRPKVITGHGASKGVVTAPAKVVRSLAEAGKLEPGDVLVCEMTMPPWTPLFSTVSAVVADSGGVLSHCAIVAREYGIPCVVGTVNGSRRIKDGQRLTVDGATGIVRIER